MRAAGFTQPATLGYKHEVSSCLIAVFLQLSIYQRTLISSAVTKGGSNHSSLFYHTILFNGKYNYFQKGILTLYGHLGLGVEITQFDPKWDDNYTEAYFGYQVSPIGINARLAQASASSANSVSETRVSSRPVSTIASDQTVPVRRPMSDRKVKI